MSAEVQALLVDMQEAEHAAHRLEERRALLALEQPTGWGPEVDAWLADRQAWEQAQALLAEMRAEAEEPLVVIQAAQQAEQQRLAKRRAEAEAALMAADRVEFKRTVIAIGVMFSLGTVLMLASFLVTGMSTRMQIQCWETSAICFFGVGDFVWSEAPGGLVPSNASLVRTQKPETQQRALP